MSRTLLLFTLANVIASQLVASQVRSGTTECSCPPPEEPFGQLVLNEGGAELILENRTQTNTHIFYVYRIAGESYIENVVISTCIAPIFSLPGNLQYNTADLNSGITGIIWNSGMEENILVIGVRRPVTEDTVTYRINGAESYSQGEILAPLPNCTVEPPPPCPPQPSPPVVTQEPEQVSPLNPDPEPVIIYVPSVKDTSASNKSLLGLLGLLGLMGIVAIPFIVLTIIFYYLWVSEKRKNQSRTVQRTLQIPELIIDHTQGNTTSTGWIR